MHAIYFVQINYHSCSYLVEREGLLCTIKSKNISKLSERLFTYFFLTALIMQTDPYSLPSSTGFRTISLCMESAQLLGNVSYLRTLIKGWETQTSDSGKRGGETSTSKTVVSMEINRTYSLVLVLVLLCFSTGEQRAELCQLVPPLCFPVMIMAVGSDGAFAHKSV